MQKPQHRSGQTFDVGVVAMTEVRKGVPWGRALPSGVSWFREALALQRPRREPGNKDADRQDSEHHVGSGEDTALHISRPP